jgi:hypothetical protein
MPKHHTSLNKGNCFVSSSSFRTQTWSFQKPSSKRCWFHRHRNPHSLNIFPHTSPSAHQLFAGVSAFPCVATALQRSAG